MEQMLRLVERLRDLANNDHKRGCQGRTYSCSCGYDEAKDTALREAAAALESGVPEQPKKDSRADFDQRDERLREQVAKTAALYDEPREFDDDERQLLDYINATPALLSLLYDLDLMPEQTLRNEDARAKTFCIADHWRVDRAAAVHPAEWVPIESAPKTGPAKTILLYVPTLHGTGGPVLAHWAFGGGDEQPAFGPAWFFWNGYSFAELRETPTHWMPLPPPPAEPK